MAGGGGHKKLNGWMDGWIGDGTRLRMRRAVDESDLVEEDVDRDVDVWVAVEGWSGPG